MLQVLTIPLTALHLAVAPIHQPARIVVTTQLQGGSVSAFQALQPAFDVKTIQGTSVQIQANQTAQNRLQPAVGIGANGFTLQ